MRLPLNRVGSLNKISEDRSPNWSKNSSANPRPKKLLRCWKLTTSEVVDTLKISGRHVSMDAPFVQGEENRLLDVLENDRRRNARLRPA